MTLEAAPFPRAEYSARKARVCERLSTAGLDGLLIAQLENICYLTGYETNGNVASTYLFVSQDGRLIFFTRRLDIGNLLPLLDEVGISDYAVYEDDEDPLGVLAELIRRNGLANGRVGVEKTSLYFSVDHFERLVSILPLVAWVDSGALIARLRLVKSEAEIAYHRAAAMIAVAGMRLGISACRPGVRDTDVASAVLEGLTRNGSSWIANWPYIKVGRNTGRGHATWQNAELGFQMPITLELAGVLRRYHSPLYRTVIFRPTEDQRRLAEIVRESNRAGIEAMGPGKTAGAVYAVFKQVVADGGYGNLLRHRNGYAVGIGFPPNWVQRPGLDIVAGGMDLLEPGMIFHVPTYLCMPDQYGMGESHTVLITSHGREVLTNDMPAGPILCD